MDVKPKTVGQFYTDEAAYLVSAAARARQITASPPPASPPKPQPGVYAEPLLDEPDRPPLAPAPAINQNRPAAPRPVSEASARPRRRLGRTLARIVIAPLYVAVALAAVGIIALMIMASFGL